MSLKLINLQIGVLFISLPLLIASSKSLANIYYYFSLTKFIKFKKYFNLALFILIILLSIVPSLLIALSLPSYDKEINDFSWLKENTPEDSVILVPYEYGNTVTYFSNRNNIADNNFLLAPNAEERLNDINTIYKTVFKIKGLELINKYNIKYIYASPVILNNYDLTRIPYIDDECFSLVKEDIYEIKC